MKSLIELYALWDRLGDVPIVDHESSEVTDGAFLHFPIGTQREEIWRWFEAQHPDFILGEVMQGIRRFAGVSP